MHLFSLTLFYIAPRLISCYTGVTVMPLLQWLIWFPAALGRQVQTQRAGSEDVHGPLNLLLDFASTTLATQHQ